MFAHSDRLPTGTPLPDGTHTPAPWGLGRMAPYPAQAPAYAGLDLDPATQVGRYYDHNGQAIDMSGPGHGTSTGTNPATNTGNPSDGSSGGGAGGGDQDTGNDSDQ